LIDHNTLSPSRYAPAHIASFLFPVSCFSEARKPKSYFYLSLLPHSTTTLFCLRAATTDLLSSFQSDTSPGKSIKTVKQ